MRGEFVDLGGARLYYYAAGTRGQGEPVVFIHGFPTSSYLWSGVLAHVPAGHRVVVLDLLGYGRSDRPNGRDVSVRGHAGRVVELMDALGINYACLVGHDVGGGVAQEIAIRHPTRVSRLCLVDSVAFDMWPGHEVKVARAMSALTRYLPATWLLSVLRTDLLRGYVDRERGTRTIERYVRPFASADGRDAFFEHLTALDNADTVALEPRLRNVVQPTAIVWGAEDPFLPSAIGERLRDEISGATLTVIPGQRHFVPEEAPDRVGATIAELLLR